MFYFERLDFLWSGWLLRASSSVFTPSRVTFGPTEYYCGRSSLWVTMATLDIHLYFSCRCDQYWLGVCPPVQVRVPTQTLLWIPTSTRWLKMAATWTGQTSPQPRCELTDGFLFNLRHVSYFKSNGHLSSQVSADDALLESGAHRQTNLQHDWSAH